VRLPTSVRSSVRPSARPPVRPSVRPLVRFACSRVARGAGALSVCGVRSALAAAARLRGDWAGRVWPSNKRPLKRRSAEYAMGLCRRSGMGGGASGTSPLTSWSRAWSCSASTTPTTSARACQWTLRRPAHRHTQRPSAMMRTSQRRCRRSRRCSCSSWLHIPCNLTAYQERAVATAGPKAPAGHWHGQPQCAPRRFRLPRAPSIALGLGLGLQAAPCPGSAWPARRWLPGGLSGGLVPAQPSRAWAAAAPRRLRPLAGCAAQLRGAAARATAGGCPGQAGFAPCEGGWIVRRLGPFFVCKNPQEKRRGWSPTSRRCVAAGNAARQCPGPRARAGHSINGTISP
jgi:hypothetical protein